MLAFELSLQLLLLIAVGFFIWRRGMVDEKFDKSVTSLLLNVALPCLIINSFNAPYSADEMRNCIILMVISVFYLALCFGLGQLIYILFGKSYTGRMLRFGAMFTNFSFVGIPVVEALYGQTGLLYFVVFVVPIRMVYYSSAKPLLSPQGMVHEKESFFQHLKGWLSPPVVAVLIGLALYISGFQLPLPIDQTISAIGAITAPLGMIICGISIGKNKLKTLFKPKYLLMPLLRNIIMPAITLAVVYPLNIDPLVAKIVVIYAALPVASLLNAFTLEYDPHPETVLESAGSVFSSILACSITIPLWAHIANLIF